MSLADDAKLLLIPTGYKASKVYSIFPTDGDGDFTYTRSGDASRVNPGGLIETISDNIPRIDHFGGGCPTLLLEPQRTNIQIRSEEFDNSAWSKVNASITANNIIAPDGEMTGDKLTSTAASVSTYVYEQHSLSTSTTYSMSVFVKKGTSNLVQMDLQDFTSGLQGRIQFDLDTETISNVVGTASVDNYGNGWYRLKCTFTTSSTLGTHYLRIFEFGTTNGATLYLWGAQVEQGDYVSSYIKTTSGQVTRQKDQCYNGGDADLFDISKGTFFIDANNFGTPLNAYSMITLSDGTLTNYIRFLYESSRIRVTLVSNNSTSIDYFITGVNDNERNKTLITFKENEFKIYHNGILKTTDTSGNVPINLDRFNFSMTNNFSRWFEGEIHDARVYDRVLTQTEAETLTTL